MVLHNTTQYAIRILNYIANESKGKLVSPISAECALGDLARFELMNDQMILSTSKTKNTKHFQSPFSANILLSMREFWAQPKNLCYLLDIIS